MPAAAAGCGCPPATAVAIHGAARAVIGHRAMLQAAATDAKDCADTLRGTGHDRDSQELSYEQLDHGYGDPQSGSAHELGSRARAFSSDEVGLVDHPCGLATGDADEDSLVQPVEVGGGSLDLGRGAEGVFAGVDVLTASETGEYLGAAVAHPS